MAQFFRASSEPTGLIDANGTEITDNSWIEADDGYYKRRVIHYVFWDDHWLCWSTIKFCEGNNKLDYSEHLSSVRHRNPALIARPKWVDDYRMANKLQYHNKDWAAAFEEMKKSDGKA